MLETCLIVFREALEAFLIVAIMLAYVTKTGRAELRQPIFAGIIAAVLISATTGWHVAELAEDPVWEGILAMTAGILVASFTAYIMKTAKTIRQDIHNHIEQSSSQGGWMAMTGVFLFTILMVAREGMETALMLGAISAQNDALGMWAGALIAIVLVAGVGYLWLVQSQRINLRLFLQVTGIFLVLFSLHLFIYGIHELGEMQALPLLSADAQLWLHEVTEPFGHDSLYAQVITYSLLAVPCAWLALSYLRDRLATKAISAAE
ncbi:MAG: FTR1 family protein [Alphaproteobacteria bacterium]|nr:FTR1 family protein [Alphaproteobacteria bacterium]